MTEVERISAIQKNGGLYLKKFNAKNITYAMCLVAVQSDGEAIYYVPEQYRTSEIFLTACKSYGKALRVTPSEMRTKEICKLAVSNDGSVIDAVPQSLKSKEMYLLAACNCPEIMKEMPSDVLDAGFVIEVCKGFGNQAISFLPQNKKTNSFFLELVDRLPELLWNIPQKNHSLEICKKAIQRMGFESSSDAVKQTPELLSQLAVSVLDHDACLEFMRAYFAESEDLRKRNDYFNQIWDDEAKLKKMLRWEDTCLIVAKNSPLFLEFAKENALTNVICLEAVKKDGRSLKYVPNRLITKEICLTALSNNIDCFEFIPTHFLDETNCLFTVEKSGMKLKYVPSELITYEMALAAVKNDADALRYVPQDLINEEICLEAIKNRDGFTRILELIPEEKRTYKVCLSAMQSGDYSFKNVPEKHRTYELCLEAAKHQEIEDELPEDYYTEELCLELVRSPGGFASIPRNRITENVCLEALRRNSLQFSMVSIFEKIPEMLITQEMCDIAVRGSRDCLKYVPDHFVTEEMLLRVAHTPGLLRYNFPRRFRNEVFVKKIISVNPQSEYYLNEVLSSGDDKDSTQIIRTKDEESSENQIEFEIQDGELKSINNFGMKTVSLPKSIVSIGYGAIQDNTVEHIIIPEGVTSIKSSAIRSRSVKRMDLPSTATSLSLGDEERWAGFSTGKLFLANLEEINVADGNPNYSSLDGILFNRDQTELIRYPAGRHETTYIVPETVVQIGDNAFDSCRNLEEIVLPNHKVSFGEACFRKCESLTKINLDDDLEEISSSMFEKSAIESISRLTHLKRIGPHAFEDSKLRKLPSLPVLESIDSFAFHSCPMQEYTMPATVQSASKWAFSDCFVRLEVIYPQKSYLIFGEDYEQMELFMRRNCWYGTHYSENDDGYMRCFKEGILSKRHLIHIATTRLCVSSADLSEEAKLFYEGVIRGNQKKAIVEFTKIGNADYIDRLLKGKYVSASTIKKILHSDDDVDSEGKIFLISILNNLT